MASRPRHRRVQRPAERAVELEVLFGLVGFRVRVRIGNLGLGSWSQVGAVSLKAYLSVSRKWEETEVKFGQDGKAAKKNQRRKTLDAFCSS